MAGAPSFQNESTLRTPTQKEPTGASQDAPGKETPGTKVAQIGSDADKMPTGKNKGESGKKNIKI